MSALPLNPPTRPIYITCITPYGPIPLTNVSFGNSVNRGKEWSFSAPSYLAPYLGDTAGLFFISIFDGVTKINSNALTLTDILPQISMGGGAGTHLSGIGFTTWVMTESDLVLGTYKESTSQALIADAASKIQISVSGVENYTLLNEDGNNQKFIEILSRIIEKSGQVWYENDSGGINVVSNMYRGPALDFHFTQYSNPISYASRVDSIKIGKTSRTSGGTATVDDNCFRFDSVGFKTGQFKQPLLRAAPYDRSLAGFVYYVTTFNGGINGVVTGEFKLQSDSINDETNIVTGPIDPTKPSTHFSCVVQQNPAYVGTDRPIDAKLCFTGIPPALTSAAPVQPLDTTFLLQIGMRSPTNTSNRTRPYKKVKVDSLYPSRAYTLSKAPNYLLEHNRGFRRCTGSGPLDLTVGLFHEYGAYGCPKMICDTYKHDISIPNNATTTISGIEVGMYDWCTTNGAEIPIEVSINPTES